MRAGVTEASKPYLVTLALPLTSSSSRCRGDTGEIQRRCHLVEQPVQGLVEQRGAEREQRAERPEESEQQRRAAAQLAQQLSALNPPRRGRARPRLAPLLLRVLGWG